MTFELTELARLKSEQINVKPNIILEIEGVSTVYGAITVEEKLKYGCPGVTYGGGFVYGGLKTLADSEVLITFKNGGTSTSIKQGIDHAKGRSSTISSMRVTLIDKEDVITNLISPGQVVADILGRRAKIWFGFEDTSFKDDFIVIFRGIIDDILAKPGRISFNLAHPDQKKKAQLFDKADTELDGGINASVTTITVNDTDDFLTPVTGPDASIDTAFKTYVRINDEVMQYTGSTATTFTGITRGELGTTAASHDDADTVESFYVLEDNVMDLALKLMLGGKEGAFQTGVTVDNFVRISPSLAVANSIFFQNVNVVDEYNLRVGDFITTTGASDGANNVALAPITDIVELTDGSLSSYIVVSGVAFVEESGTAAVIDFRSQYDTFPIGAGLTMHNDEVDIFEHERVRDLFLSAFSMRHFIKDSIDGKEFLEQQIYLPSSTFFIPKNARASVGIHFPPLPGADIKILDNTNIVKPGQVGIRRAIGKNFYNTVVYRFDELVLEDRLIRGVITQNATSISRIPVGVKPLIITARGLRSDLSGVSIANTATTRRLNKFKFGAEFLENVQLLFKDGFNINIGQVLLLDFDSIGISDIASGTRSGEPRLVEVVNKRFDFTGIVTLDIVDTDFDKDARYGLIGPCSEVKSGISNTQFIIQETGNSQFGQNEFRKWDSLIGASIRVHNSDFSTTGTALIDALNGNTVTVASSLGFTPSAGQRMDFSPYDDQPDNVKAIYVFMQNNATFADGKIQYQMI